MVAFRRGLLFQFIFLSIPIIDSVGLDFSNDIDPDYFNDLHQNLDSQTQCKYFQVHESRQKILLRQFKYIFLFFFNIRSVDGNSNIFF